MSSECRRKTAAGSAMKRAFGLHSLRHFARPCSVSGFRVNSDVSNGLKILTLADCFKVERKNGTSMKIHEYQAKAILARYGVTTPRGEVAFTKEEAREAAQPLKAPVVVVKAQLHAGGRGKAGGVKLARSADEAAELASHILGMTLVTPQTGPQGRVVRRLLIEEGLDIKRELYLGLLMSKPSSISNRRTTRPCGPVCGVTSVIPKMCEANSAASSAERASFTPPAFPRPPA